MSTREQNKGLARRMTTTEAQKLPKESAPTPQQTVEIDQDRIVVNMLDDLRRTICHFSQRYFNFNTKDPVEKAIGSASPQLISYIGCIAIGGPSGSEGWRQLLQQPQLRKAVVCGVVGRVVQEHVIASLCFGAEESLIGTLTNMERSQVEKDGFYRAEQRQIVLEEWFASGKLLANTELAVTRIALQIARLLQPILDLDYLHADQLQIEENSVPYLAELRSIVAQAQELNLFIRMNGDVVYYFESTYKDEEFDIYSMTCMNLEDMQRTCPFIRVDNNSRETKANDPLGDDSDKALVRVVCHLGCVAYRKGGGDLGKRLLHDDKDRLDLSVPPEARSKRPKNEVYGRIITDKDGFRSKKIAKSIVALRWGKPQFTEQPQFRQNYVELADVQRELNKYNVI